MDLPSVTPANPKRMRWLWLPGVAVVVLGGFVWWNVRCEWRQVVETIWSDSLVGHENQSVAMGERRQIGELWSLKRSAGCVLFGRGLSQQYTGQYPVFAASNSFLQAVSDQLQTENREAAAEFATFDWSEWWSSAKVGWSGNAWEANRSMKLLFLDDRAVSFRQTDWEYTGGAHGNFWSVGRNFVDVDGSVHELELAELFVGSAWVSALSDYCVDDLRRQEASSLENVPQPTFGADDMSSFALTRDGLSIFFAPYAVGSYAEGEFEVRIPWQTLDQHWKPDGPHRLFQDRTD